MSSFSSRRQLAFKPGQRVNWGAFRELFRGVAWKRLSPHEVDPTVSNGHEFQGINRLRDILGNEERKDLSTTYFIFGDEDDAPERLRATSSWYDARAKDPNRSAEWRLYYPAEAGVLQSQMQAGDLMIIAALESGELAVLLARRASSREAQLATLFGIDLEGAGSVQTHLFGSADSISFAAALILEELGLGSIEPHGSDRDLASTIASELIDQFGGQLPRGELIASGFRSGPPM